MSRTQSNHVPSPYIKDYLKQAGFHHVCEIENYKMDKGILTALVERWRPETHTFHFPTGECTITLEDVYMLLGLNVGGFPVTGMASIGWSWCEEVLGVEIPTEAKDGNFLKILWLKKTFIGLTEDASVDKKIQHTRAHILILIGGFLFPNTSGDTVHCSWLTLLSDFNRTRQYSCGSAVLATLYRGMCEASQAGYATLSGCTFLLQVWAYYRLDYIAPQTHKEFTFPFATKWTGRGANYYKNPRHSVQSFRLLLDHIQHDQFIWRPYRELEYDAPEDFWLWSATTYLICFDKVEWHSTDRVKLQFGLPQDIPAPPRNMRSYHHVDKRTKHWNTSYQSLWPDEYEHWLNRLQWVLDGMPHPRWRRPTAEYIQWFKTICNPNVHICEHHCPRETQLTTTTV